MTTEEKTREIGFKTIKLNDLEVAPSALNAAAMSMAKWKDQQFKEYLEKKASEAKYKRDADTSFANDWDIWNNRYWVYMAIINELFEE